MFAFVRPHELIGICHIMLCCDAWLTDDPSSLYRKIVTSLSLCTLLSHLTSIKVTVDAVRLSTPAPAHCLEQHG